MRIGFCEEVFGCRVPEESTGVTYLERGEESMVDVDDRTVVGMEEVWGEYLHVSSEDEKVGAE